MFKRSGKKSGISTKQHSAARIRQRRMIAIALATLVSAVALLWLVLRKNDPVVPYTWRDFEQAFERGDDDRMIAMYDELRLFRADLISTDKSSVQSVITETDQLIRRVEEKVALRGKALLSEAAKGDSWTPKETYRMARYVPIATTSFFEYIHAVIADYLEGNVDESTIVRFADNVVKILPFRQEFGTFFSNKSTMTAARELIDKVLKSGVDKNREEQLALLDGILNNKTFKTVKPLIHYVHDKMMEVKRVYYGELMPEIRDHMYHEQTYDAEQKIKRLIRWFSEDEELLSYYAVCKEVNPERVIFWRDPVEHLSLKPLIADPDRAFDGDVFQPAADRDLVMISELERALDVLYQKDYVLINERSLVNEKGQLCHVPVPEGKKPLVLVLEDFYSSGPRTESGIAHRLELNDEGQLIGVVLDLDGTERRDRSFTAIGVIEAFVERRPDFSFNGARGTIALVGQFGLFGYPMAQVQDLAWQYNAKNQGSEGIKPVSSDYEENRNVVTAILDALHRKNWNIASGSYHRISVPFSSEKDLLEDFMMWERWIKPHTGDVWAFYYPFGEHAELYPKRTAILKEHGLILQCGYGPTPYWHQSDGYLYVSRVLLSGYNLRHAKASGLDRLMSSNVILDTGARR